MRSRSNSGVRLDYYMRMVAKTVLNNADPVTGLFASTLPGCTDHAWVRDNVYAVHCVWGLSLAYKKHTDFDEDRAKAYELQQICIKVMRSLLTCMMRQISKVERFKSSQSARDALHAKYSARNCSTVVGDFDWGHLQIDAVSLFLLTLAQLTASGLQIVYNLDEVAFIQNLVFCIESAYRIPDYGIWERGDKTNHGLPELNATSIGMAKAALQAMNDLDLFGAHGSPNSVIHVLADEIQQCQAVLQSMLPRESYSKETDAGIMSIISYPAFAVEDAELIESTRHTIVSKLQGRYGCRRFLRDGYKTAREDSSRLYYEPWELQRFENIECEWPLFFCYFVLDGLFSSNKIQVNEYRQLLEAVVVRGEEGVKLVPELYTVSADKVDAEAANSHSQPRSSAGTTPYLWAQSLYILGCLIEEGFIQAAELDPLNRRLCTERRPDTVVQVVVLAEDQEVKEYYASQGIRLSTVDEVSPYVVQPASVLGKLFSQLGKNAKLGLTGRPIRDVGLLSTSKIYKVDDRVFIFTPQFIDWQRFYLTHDINILLDVMKSEMFYVKTSWNVPGRPLVAVTLTRAMLAGSASQAEGGKKAPLGIVGTLKKLQSGYLSGTRVIMGKIEDFLTTSCITKLHFLRADTENDALDKDVRNYLATLLTPTVVARPRLPSVQGKQPLFARRMSVEHRDKMSIVRNFSQRAKSIVLDADDDALRRLRLKYSGGSNLQSPRYSETTESASPADSATPHGSPREEFSFDFDSRPASSPPLLRSGARSGSASRFEAEDLSDLDCNELVDMLLETESLEEQADIVHYLWIKQGPDWDTHIGGKSGAPVRKLVEELYDKALYSNTWWLVRHTAGQLEKRVEDAAKAVTDMLVRQKQVTVGMPAIREEAITRPLSPEELQKVIKLAFVDDDSSAMLTTEILVNLGMFVRTEPQLFSEMLRLRVGLIIQVMASELARALHCSGEEASQHLLNLSPYELKTLLHHILSGKEFGEREDEPQQAFLTYTEKSKAERTGILQLRKKLMQQKVLSEEPTEEGATEPLGQWLRRRRIDGALNRVPPDFYTKLWLVLRKCEGLSIEGHVLHQNLTKEMTSGEIKFALTVESVLNRISDPEYRQLLVESLMVLTMIAENQTNIQLGPGLVRIEDIVHVANDLFLRDQKSAEGDAKSCCAKDDPEPCGGVENVCKHFYDSSPSGRYGTITYMCRAIATIMPHTGEDVECAVS